MKSVREREERRGERRMKTVITKNKNQKRYNKVQYIKWSYILVDRNYIKYYKINIYIYIFFKINCIEK